MVMNPIDVKMIPSFHAIIGNNGCREIIMLISILNNLKDLMKIEDIVTINNTVISLGISLLHIIIRRSLITMVKGIIGKVDISDYHFYMT